MRLSAGTLAGVKAAAGRVGSKTFYRYVKTPTEGEYGTVNTPTRVGEAFTGHLGKAEATEVPADLAGKILNRRVMRLAYVRASDLSIEDMVGPDSGAQLWEVIGADGLPVFQGDVAVRLVYVAQVKG